MVVCGQRMKVKTLNFPGGESSFNKSDAGSSEAENASFLRPIK